MFLELLNLNSPRFILIQLLHHNGDKIFLQLGLIPAENLLQAASHHDTDLFDSQKTLLIAAQTFQDGLEFGFWGFSHADTDYLDELFPGYEFGEVTDIPDDFIARIDFQTFETFVECLAIYAFLFYSLVLVRFVEAHC